MYKHSHHIYGVHLYTHGKYEEKVENRIFALAEFIICLGAKTKPIE